MIKNNKKDTKEKMKFIEFVEGKQYSMIIIF
jgi:hypothetical protein